jgi:hypothetical protein
VCLSYQKIFAENLVNQNIPAVLEKLAWMRVEGIWPEGLRYLWTDAFGLVLLVSLYHELQDERYLTKAEGLMAEVERVLRRPRGLRIGRRPGGTARTSGNMPCNPSSCDYIYRYDRS